MSWSYSMLSTWEQCPAKWRYRYKESLPDPGNKATNAGHTAHKVIEDYLKGELVQLEKRMQPMFNLLERLKTVAKAEPWIGLDDKWNQVPYKEAWLKSKLDAVEEPKDDIVTVWEWKTGRIYETHEHQRELYGLVALVVHPVKQAIVNSYYIDQKQSAVTVIHQERQEELRKEWEQRVQFMEQDKVNVARPGWYCSRCSYSRDKQGPCRFG